MDGLTRCTCFSVRHQRNPEHSSAMARYNVDTGMLLSGQQTPHGRRHYTKCKPSRRKSSEPISKLLRSVVEIWSIFLNLTILDCPGGYIYNWICNNPPSRQRTRQTWRPFMLWVFVISLTGFLPLSLCETDQYLQPTPSALSNQLPDVIAPVGSAFVYTIPESSFECDVDRFMVSITFQLLATLAHTDLVDNQCLRTIQ